MAQKQTIQQRIGCDVSIAWELEKDDGTLVDLSGVEELKVYVRHRASGAIYEQQYSLVGGIIFFDFIASEQGNNIGFYDLYATWERTDESIEGGVRSFKFDEERAFQLVSRTSEVTYRGEGEIEITSRLTEAIRGPKGEKLTYNDLTEADIENLRRPATEAAEALETLISETETAKSNAETATGAANTAAQNAQQVADTYSTELGSKAAHGYTDDTEPKTLQQVDEELSELKFGGENLMAMQYLLDLNNQNPEAAQEYSDQHGDGICLSFNKFHNYIININSLMYTFKQDTQYALKIRARSLTAYNGAVSAIRIDYYSGKIIRLGISGEQANIVERSFITEKGDSVIFIGIEKLRNVNLVIYDFQITEGTRQTEGWIESKVDRHKKIDNKVDQEPNKQLTSNDFTDELKTKVEGSALHGYSSEETPKTLKELEQAQDLLLPISEFNKYYHVIKVNNKEELFEALAFTGSYYKDIFCSTLQISMDVDRTLNVRGSNRIHGTIMFIGSSEPKTLTLNGGISGSSIISRSELDNIYFMEGSINIVINNVLCNWNTLLQSTTITVQSNNPEYKIKCWSLQSYEGYITGDVEVFYPKHSHNDVYYTKDEIDTKLDNKAAHGYGDGEDVNTLKEIDVKVTGIDELVRSNLWYGIEWDEDVADSACTRIGNLDLHRTLPIQSKVKKCLLRDDGTVNYYTHSENGNLKEDGTTAILDGSHGMVQNEIPEHWRRFDSNGKKHRAMISEYPLLGFHFAPRCYRSAYHATVDRTDPSTPKLASVVNTSPEFRGGNNNPANDANYNTLLGMPATAISLLKFREYARNRGTAGFNGAGWNCDLYQPKKIVDWLYFIEYANFNCQLPFNQNVDVNGFKQGGLGYGVTLFSGTSWNEYNGYYPFVPCGHTNALGNVTGTVPFTFAEESGLTNTFDVPSYRGIELPFGHIWNWLDGVMLKLNSDELGGKLEAFICDNPSLLHSTNFGSYKKIGNLPDTEGWVKAMILGEFGENLPKAVGASSTTHFSDYFYRPSKPESGFAVRGVLFGGGAYNGSSAGLSSAGANSALSSTSARLGSRLCFLPTV